MVRDDRYIFCEDATASRFRGYFRLRGGNETWIVSPRQVELQPIGTDRANIVVLPPGKIVADTFN